MYRALKQAVKRELMKYQAKRRAKELQQTQPHVTQEDITQGLKALGVVNGDILFVHSSLKSLGYVEGGPQAVIEGMLTAVGTEGTVILPTYYLPGGTILGTCQLKDYVFDPRIHGTNMGALPETFLKFPGVQRSIHPTHSVSAIGKHARYITEAHHQAPSTFGTGSPWQRFHELNGKVLGLGVSMGPITFYHLIEDMMGDEFPIRVWTEETYSLECRDWGGNPIHVNVRPYKPELMPVRIDHPTQKETRDQMRRQLDQKGLLKEAEIGAARSWVVEADDFFQFLCVRAREGKTIYSNSRHSGDAC